MAKQMQGNQTEGEYFAVVETGRRGVENMMEKMTDELKTIAAPTVADNLSVWQKRAVVWITGQKDLMERVCNSRAGLLSVYQGLARAATMGMQAGGNYPHFYLVPRDGKAVFVPTADGIGFAATYGPGGVLAHVPKLVKVYENDTLRISDADGDYTHTYDPRGDRGKLALYLMQLEYKDGRKVIEYVTARKVFEITEAYSTKTYPGGKQAPAWAKSAEEMLDKTAAKRLLKKAAAESEGLSMLLSSEEEFSELAPESPDVAERMSGRLDRMMDSAGPVPERPEPEPVDVSPGSARDESPEYEEPIPETAEAEEPPQDEGGELDIF
jgi:recombinational DNA repair protein RecT